MAFSDQRKSHIDQQCLVLVNYVRHGHINPSHVPDESRKRTAFGQIRLAEYQNNDVENCLASLPICSIGPKRVLIGHSFPWGRFFCIKPLSKLAKTSESNYQTFISFCS